MKVLKLDIENLWKLLFLQPIIGPVVQWIE